MYMGTSMSVREVLLLLLRFVVYYSKIVLRYGHLTKHLNNEILNPLPLPFSGLHCITCWFRFRSEELFQNFENAIYEKTVTQRPSLKRNISFAHVNHNLPVLCKKNRYGVA